MAELAQVVHPDIRPGYDVTYNILWKLDDATKTVKMKLIDFDSLVPWSAWKAPDKSFGKYSPESRFSNATVFVWWQCVAVAYAWIEKIKYNELYQGTAEKSSHMEKLMDALDRGKWVPGWLAKARENTQQKINGDKGRALLEHLSEPFKQNVDDSAGLWASSCIIEEEVES